MTLFIARAELRKDASIGALAPLLLTEDPKERVLAAHRLAWSLMPSDPDAKCDFLWREEAPGRFMLLGARPPAPSALFDVACKPFEPALRSGDRLHFVLRANPTVARREPSRRGRRDDVVMHALHQLDGKTEGARAAARPQTIVEQGTAWLTRIGDRHGFALDRAQLAVDGYQRIRIPRGSAGAPIQIATLEYEGTLTVTDPSAFLAGLTVGFGCAHVLGKVSTQSALSKPENAS